MSVNQPRWTEDELRREINRLRACIDRVSQSPNSSARSAVSYLNQLLQDRRDDLAVLTRRQTH